jgi:acylphosphatase
VSILGVKASLVKVFGRVQRVGYRRHVLDSAQELGLSGYVRNEKDGSVTVFVQGDDEAVEKFIEKLKTPPQPAHVKSLEVKDARPRPALKYFTIKPSPLHEELQEGFGAMQSIFIDYWGEFRGFVESSEDSEDLWESSGTTGRNSVTTDRSSGISERSSETIGMSLGSLLGGQMITLRQ